jgi:hypothetical protein
LMNSIAVCKENRSDLPLIGEFGQPEIILEAIFESRIILWVSII